MQQILSARLIWIVRHLDYCYSGCVQVLLSYLQTTFFFWKTSCLSVTCKTEKWQKVPKDVTFIHFSRSTLGGCLWGTWRSSQHANAEAQPTHAAGHLLGSKGISQQDRYGQHTWGLPQPCSCKGPWRSRQGQHLSKDSGRKEGVKEREVRAKMTRGCEWWHWANLGRRSGCEPRFI